MTWFEDEEWIGLTISFDQLRPTTWRLVQKIRERELWASETSWKEDQDPSEARGIFICEEEGSAHRRAVVKIYMQYDTFSNKSPPLSPKEIEKLMYSRIPYYGTISKPRGIRAMQARTEVEYRAEQEIAALQGLTDANCSATPALLAWKHTVQDDERYVPGGYITYILMERCPGINLQCLFQLPREERDQIRAAFKKAWQ